MTHTSDTPATLTVIHPDFVRLGNQDIEPARSSSSPSLFGQLLLSGAAYAIGRDPLHDPYHQHTGSFDRDHQIVVRAERLDIARFHAVIARDEHGYFVLHNYSHSKLTFVNDQRIEKDKRLEHRAIIGLGNASRMLVFEQEHIPTLQQQASLTTREVEILQLLADGYSNKAIGTKLVIALPTVSNHLQNIYQKLGVKSRTEAINQARKDHLLS